MRFMLVTLATMLAMLVLGTAYAQDEEAAGDDNGSEKPYSVETQWEQTTVGDATVTFEMHLDMEAWDVYERFLETSNWWSRGFTMGQDKSLSMQLEAYAGGRLFEIYEDGEIQWASVLQVEPGRFIGMGVPEGTFWSGAGSINISFNPAEDGGTDLLLVHRAFQQYDAEQDGAAGYAMGWSQLIGENFRRYCTGEPVEDAILQIDDNAMSGEMQQ